MGFLDLKKIDFCLRETSSHVFQLVQNTYIVTFFYPVISHAMKKAWTFLKEEKVDQKSLRVLLQDRKRCSDHVLTFFFHIWTLKLTTS